MFAVLIYCFWAINFTHAEAYMDGTNNTEPIGINVQESAQLIAQINAIQSKLTAQQQAVPTKVLPKPKTVPKDIPSVSKTNTPTVPMDQKKSSIKKVVLTKNLNQCYGSPIYYK